MKTISTAKFINSSGSGGRYSLLRAQREQELGGRSHNRFNNVAAQTDSHPKPIVTHWHISDMGRRIWLGPSPWWISVQLMTLILTLTWRVCCTRRAGTLRPWPSITPPSSTLDMTHTSLITSPSATTGDSQTEAARDYYWHLHCSGWRTLPRLWNTSRIL